jgi:hypothetical protein
MISFKRALPSAARWDRPKNAFSSAAKDQPGRLAQGPEEKEGLAGFWVGLLVILALPLEVVDASNAYFLRVFNLLQLRNISSHNFLLFLKPDAVEWACHTNKGSMNASF